MRRPAFLFFLLVLTLRSAAQTQVIVDVAADNRDARWRGTTTTENPPTDEQLNNGAGKVTVAKETNYDAAFAFQVTGPASGDTINSATIQVNVTYDGLVEAFAIRGALANNVSVYDDAHSHSVTTHHGALTTANVSWKPSGTGSKTSPDIKDVLQEIINQPGWASGNFLAIVFDHTPLVTVGEGMGFEDYSDAGNDPATLTLTYTPAGGGAARRRIVVID
jgi:hypothetical protein